MGEQKMISLSRYWRTTKLIDRCSRRPADERAWQEFVRRFHLTIQGSVVKAFNSRAEGIRGNGGLQLGEELKDDLVQSVYRRLVENRSRLLKRFRGQPSSFCGLLAIVSVNVVSSYLRDSLAQCGDEGSEIRGKTRSSAGAR
jgi:hypothetical protein